MKMKPVNRKSKSLRTKILTESKNENICMKAVDRKSGSLRTKIANESKHGKMDMKGYKPEGS